LGKGLERVIGGLDEGTRRLTGIGLLIVGLGLLLFTFWCGYMEYLSVPHIEISATDPWETFTEALKYLIEPCIKVMFLGVMGWTGVVLTSRGVQLIRGPPIQQQILAPPPTGPTRPAPAPSVPPTPPGRSYTPIMAPKKNSSS